MKNIYKIAVVLSFSAIMASCTKHESLDFHVDEPASFLAQKEIDSYSALKSYIKRDAQPNFKLGAAISLSDYINKGVMYRLVNSNFDEITIGYEMKHGAVVKADGTLDLNNVKNLLKAASGAGISVYGHTLCWHANQNATYLNSLIAPTVIPGNGPALEANLIPNSNFELGNSNGWGGWGNGSTRGISANGQGLGGAGYSLYMTNPKVVNSWEAQTPYDFSAYFQNGSVYKLSFYVKGSIAGSASVALQETVTYGADDFGSFPVTTEWKLVELEKTVTKADRKRFLFSFGAYAGTLNFDNISLRRLNPNSGEQAIAKTATEKKVIIDQALNRFISGMVDTCKSYVKVWDVVNEPMDDANPYELKSGIGKTLKADEFYWQDYMGKDYAVRAFQLARAHGNTGDLHFINDYNLEYSLDKCKGLIDYVKYIESKGAKVDGIGTQMHIDATSDKGKIDEMFRLLAATGKIIKVSELDMGVGAQTTVATAEQYAAQAAMYKYVIAKYFELIPAAQRYGITIWSPLDSPKSSSWRAGEPIGLWTEGFVRKPSYVGVADGLAGK
ncbi:endo-1,4-beta-xylanase [Arcticibacter eurypsychrophilus]|uniref:endo-1,4-beta-xylanase n=1 Tax=Arcticibacter eurypsychrophilus TaxID=1434752 RepID=UPI00084D3174|nr:endo-1,4-beta-xylanase [Arcticibacter eurypsychrophilus]